MPALPRSSRPSRPGRSVHAPRATPAPILCRPSGSVKSCPPDVPIRTAGTPGGLGGADQRRGVRHRQHVAALVLAEPVGMAGDVRAGRWQRRAPVAAGHRHFGHRHQQPAIGNVVAGADRAGQDLRRARSRRCARSAARSTGGGAPSSRPAISRSQSDWPSQPLRGADQHEVEPRAERDARPPSPHRPARRARRSPAWAGCAHVPVARLVVEADIAGHDREVERLAGRGHAADRGGELAHDLRASRGCRNSCCR